MALLVSLVVPTLTASEYGIAKTVWNVPRFTNITGTATQLLSAVDCTTATDFALQVTVKATNAMAGTLDCVWDTSIDNANFPNVTNASLGRVTGWFSIPLSNNNVVITWLTNVTTDAIGYWRLRALTNAAGQSITNISITAWIKPRRRG